MNIGKITNEINCKSYQIMNNSRTEAMCESLVDSLICYKSGLPPADYLIMKSSALKLGPAAFSSLPDKLLGVVSKISKNIF